MMHVSNFLQRRICKSPCFGFGDPFQAGIVCTCRHVGLADEVIRSLEFAAPVKHIADRILQEMGTKNFHALHLRVEDDLRERSDADPMIIRKVRGHPAMESWRLGSHILTHSLGAWCKQCICMSA